ncbi:MAG: UDP-N-acetylglucosamine--N-acetylmuramyl-(pentapeptide) pyrophosphoryl-undecaprenol N-acetylglucosamine transferase [Planctomycetaceae bacterium]
MTSPRTYLFAGGGSGGHLMPGLAVAEELRNRDPACEIVFAVSGRPIEQTVLADSDVRRECLPAHPPGTLRRSPFRFAFGLGRSLHRAIRLIDELRPAAVIGLGGFASVPVAVTAVRRSVPLILLEQNVVPGRATSWLSRTAEVVCLSFHETRTFLPPRTRTIVTGNPLRRSIALSARRKTAGDLMILGGSQGAAGVNAAATAAIIAMKDRLAGRTIVHQTGERDANAVRTAYERAGIDAEVAAYFPDLLSRYTKVELAISRAGATTLAELACLGCPAVLMPYPGSVRNHQQRNAEHYRNAGGASIVPDGPEAANHLVHVLDRLLSDPEKSKAMSHSMHRTAMPDSAARVADLILPRVASRTAA